MSYVDLITMTVLPNQQNGYVSSLMGNNNFIVTFVQLNLPRKEGSIVPLRSTKMQLFFNATRVHQFFFSEDYFDQTQVVSYERKKNIL